MKNRLKFTLASLLFAGAMVGCSASKAPISFNGVLNKQQEQTLAYQSASSLSVISNLSSVNTGLTIKSKQNHRDFDEITSEQKSKIEELLPIADLYSNGINYQSEILESDREGYEIKQVISFDDMTTGTNFYTLYYNIDFSKEYVDKHHDGEHNNNFEDHEHINEYWKDHKHNDGEHGNHHGEGEHEEMPLPGEEIPSEEVPSEETPLPEPVEEHYNWNEHGNHNHGNHGDHDEGNSSSRKVSKENGVLVSDEVITSEETSVDSEEEIISEETPVTSEEEIPSEEPATSEEPVEEVTNGVVKTRFSGVAVIEDLEFPFEGKTEKEIDDDETEEEMKFIISTSETSFIKLEQEIEAEDDEIEEEYKYSIYEDGRKVYGFSFEKENKLETNKEKVELKMVVDGIKYQFKFFDKNGEDFIRVKVDQGRDDYSITYKRVVTETEEGVVSVSYEEVIK